MKKISLLLILIPLYLSAAEDLLENYFNLGKEHYVNGRYDDALFNFKEAFELFPMSPEILTNMGLCHEKTGNFEEAEKNYEAALQISRDYIDALNNLGLLLLRRQKSLEYGSLLIRRALDLNPDKPELMESMGISYFYHENYDTAVYWFEKAFAAGLNRGSLNNSLGMAYLKLGRKKEALESFKKVLKTDPSDAHAITGIVRILEKWEDYEGVKAYMNILDTRALKSSERMKTACYPMIFYRNIIIMHFLTLELH